MIVPYEVIFAEVVVILLGSAVSGKLTVKPYVILFKLYNEVTSPDCKALL